MGFLEAGERFWRTVLEIGTVSIDNKRSFLVSADNTKLDNCFKFIETLFFI